MAKRNIVLITILIFVVALFATYTVQSCEDNSDEKQEIITTSPIPTPFETLVENVFVEEVE